MGRAWEIAKFLFRYDDGRREEHSHWASATSERYLPGNALTRRRRRAHMEFSRNLNDSRTTGDYREAMHEGWQRSSMGWLAVSPCEKARLQPRGARAFLRLTKKLTARAARAASCTDSRVEFIIIIFSFSRSRLDVEGRLFFMKEALPTIMPSVPGAAAVRTVSGTHYSPPSPTQYLVTLARQVAGYRYSGAYERINSVIVLYSALLSPRSVLLSCEVSGCTCSVLRGHEGVPM